MTKCILFLLLILQINVTYSQEKIIKIHDANLFELDNGKMIRLAGIRAPSIKDTNEKLQTVANEAIKYSKNEILRTSIRVDYDLSEGNMSDTLAVIVNVIYLGSVEDLNEYYLERGFADLETTYSGPNLSSYQKAEQKARQNSRGIWGELHSNIRTPSIEVSHNLIISVLAFGLSWDYFSEVRQIQDNIDLFKKSIPNVNVSKLEGHKSRKQILAYTFLLAGIINTFFTIQDVEISGVQNKINFKYNF